MYTQTVQTGCRHIDISQKGKYQEEYDYDSLVPPVQISQSEQEILNEYHQKQKETQGMDALPLDLFNQMLNYCVIKKDFRSIFWLTAMANMGLRYSDVIRFRRADFIDENGKVRNSILIQEKKTDKQRVIFINKAIKEALLMLLWNEDIAPMDYLITSGANRKGYELETYVDENGKTKAVRKKGKYIYKLDEHGNKIPKPLSRRQSENIMKNIIIESLGLALKNDWRCKNETDVVGKICTHSIRKLYANAITNGFVNQFDSDEAYAHAAALKFLSQDYGHSSEAMTTRYSKDFDNLKRSIVTNMNLGLEAIHNAFQEEAIKYIATLNK